MGWFWGASDDQKSQGSAEDPLRKLDPSLRDFLLKESPVKYNVSNPSQSPNQASSPESNTAPPQSSAAKDSKPPVPAESLFQDGRYAHLWGSYRPLNEVENEAKSDAEKIQDVLEGYKYRKGEIGRAALENCALEQWDVNECFRNGGIKQRLMMCRAENRKFERCYMMQAKFLKALGYMSTFDRPSEVDERIQMHADTLYHKMLAQEAATEAAKAAGEAIPEFPPLLSSTKAKSPSSSTSDDKYKAFGIPRQEEGVFKTTNVKDSTQKQFDKRLDGLSGEERELEERAIKAEINVGEEVARNLQGIYDKQAEERATRREQGRETMADRFTRIFRGN